MTELQLSEVGFRGRMFSPEVSNPRPAVLVIGGSNGGLASSAYAAAGLADAGFPALAIAYFREPGLPDRLTTIPLEYFATALEWLQGQPGVDPDAVATWGVSRGSEAALLLGVNYPKLVHGVVALVPSNVTVCGQPNCSQPAWTINGTVIPYQTMHGPTVVSPDTAIPVESIAGPILLVCGELDGTWPSCPMARAIMARLDQQPHQLPHVLLEYSGSGHEIGCLQPISETVLHGQFSPCAPSADEAARHQAWPRALRFLAEIPNTDS